MKTSFYKIFISKSPSDNLEYISPLILQKTNNLFNKNSNNIFIYALLILNNLKYRTFLNSENDIKNK